MTRTYSRRGILVLAGLATAGCALPRGAARRGEILAAAAGPLPDVTLVQVTRPALAALHAWPVTGEPAHAGWPGGGTPAAPRIAPGDRLDLRVWDSADSSLISTPGEMAVEMPGLTVGPSGEIFLPYVSEVRVAGLTPESARRLIQERMEAIVPSAQVQLGLAQGQGSSVDLVAGVSRPGRYPLEGGTTVLSALSLGGGVPPSMRNPRVRLVRGGQAHVISLARLYAEPARDAPLRGGDRLIVEEDGRHFIALGAAGREEVLDFPADEVSALRAISMMGGVSDLRADPQGVLVLRAYPAEAVARPGGPPTSRVVFSIDLTSADGLFSANEFPIRSGDVVLATESPTTSLQTVFGLLGNALGLAGRANNL